MDLEDRIKMMERLDEKGDKLWWEGCQIEAKRFYGRGDIYKVKANGLYAMANTLYEEVTQEEKSAIAKRIRK